MIYMLQTIKIITIIDSDNVLHEENNKIFEHSNFRARLQWQS